MILAVTVAMSQSRLTAAGVQHHCTAVAGFMSLHLCDGYFSWCEETW